MIEPLRASRRRGYSLTVVLIFLILLFALWAAVYRTTSSVLRIETNRVLQQSRDRGPMNALAQAVQLLQYSTPSDLTNPDRTQFTYGVTTTVANPDGSCGVATVDYTVVYTFAPIVGDPNRWQVQVSPGTYSVPLPQISSSIQWP
jgi:hypothetical protein